VRAPSASGAGRRGLVRKVPRLLRSDRLELTYGASLGNVRDCLAEVRRWVGGRLPDDCLWASELVLAEALTNIVEHACRGRTDACFTCEVTLSPGRLACRLRDDGRPMPGLRAPEGAEQDVDVPVSDLPEGGYGWNLIRKLTGRLAYFRADGVNHLSFEIDAARVSAALACRNDAPFAPQHGPIGPREQSA